MTEPNTNWATPEGERQAPTPENAPPALQSPPLAPQAPVPQSAVPVATPKKKSGALVNAVLVVAALVAVGGVAFAVGRSTAPAQASVFPGGQGMPPGFAGGLPGGSFDPGQAGPGGMPGGGDRTMSISGTVTSFDGSTLVITTASGGQTTIDVSGADFHAQANASAADVQVGSEVTVATEGFGFRRPDASAAPVSGSGAITATDVTITSGE